jgi:hypothetical protein
MAVTCVCPAAVYVQGIIITINVHMTVGHGGRFSFSVCPSGQTSLTQACFNANPLTR